MTAYPGGRRARTLVGATALCALAALVARAPRAATQAPMEGLALVPPNHEKAVPDYVAAVAALAERNPGVIAMPPPPVERTELTPPDRDERAPDYLASLGLGGPALDIPPPPPGRVPAVVRGLYLNGWVFSSQRFFDLVALADTTEINAFVIDVKDATGDLTYRSNVPTAVAIGANARARVEEVRRRLDLLERRGIHSIARIVVARDPKLARGKPDWAIHDARTGALWRDGLGEAWVDAHSDSVWIYAADLAAEAVLLGFKEVQFDYVRFPDEPPQRLSRTVYPARIAGESKRDAIRRNARLLGRRVKALGVPFTLDVFGLAATATGDLGIGQVWEDLSGIADVMLPMVYPSHYRRGSFGIAHPNAAPYETVRRALLDAMARSRRVPDPAQIRPYLQGFTIYRVRYGPEQIRAQIRAAEELGISDWVVWNARGVYPAGAFRRDRSREGQLTTPAGSVDGFQAAM
jgi:hypothetical protein